MEEESFRALMSLPHATSRATRPRSSSRWRPGPRGPTSPRRRSRRCRSAGAACPTTERREIESHVSHTYEFLQKIPWTGELRRIPEIAWAHHEKLDGSGYPRGLKAAGHPDPVPDDDDRRHLRRARGLGPALQDARSPEERARTSCSEEAQAGKIDARPAARVPRGEDLSSCRTSRACCSRGPSRVGHAPLVIAHRGDSAHRPENTLASFAGALELGAALVELDIQLTRGRPRGRDPRPQPRAHHHRPRRRAPADAGRGPRGVGGLPGPLRRAPTRASASRPSPRPSRSCAAGRGRSWRSRPSR